MKALVFTGYGPLKDVVQWRDLPVPAPRQGEVLLRVRARSINPIDWKIVEGGMKTAHRYPLPSPFGFDASGEVVERGPGAGFAVGDQVYVRASRDTIGTFAEFVALPAVFVAPKPRNLSHNEAASLPLVALTTRQALVDRAHVQPGQRILIHAGSGGVGTFAIQYAKALGLHVTTTTSAKNTGWVKDLGADEVIAYDQQDYREGGRRFDVVFNTLGGDYNQDAVGVIVPGGVLVSIAGPPDLEMIRVVGARPPASWVMWWLGASLRARARRAGVRYFRFLTESSGDQLREITTLVEARKVRPVIDRVFPFEQSLEALAYADLGRSKGKVIISGPGD